MSVTNKLLLFTLTLFTSTIFCLEFTQSEDATTDYLGCYNDVGPTKLFLSTPGEYIPHELSPMSCIRACGKRWSYAGIENGNICLCSNQKPDIFSNDAECSSKCSIQWPKNLKIPSCGGLKRISVYDISKRISALHIADIQTQVYQEVTLKATISNGDGANFLFWPGDGNVIMPKHPTNPEATYIYGIPGLYEVGTQASNNVSGVYVSKGTTNVSDPVKNGILSCQEAQEFHKDVQCTGSFVQGSPLTATFDFGDGWTETITANVQYGNVGTKYTYSRLSEESRNTKFTMVLPKDHFKTNSLIRAWEFEALSKGPIYLQIFRPKCVNGEIYCDVEHACLPENSQCNTLNEPTCTSNELFCFIAQKCIPKTTLTQSCSTNTGYNFRKTPADFEVIAQTPFTITTLGRQILELNEPLLVNKDDIIGWTSAGGELSYAELSINDPPEFYYNAATNVSTILTRADSALKYWRHIIIAHYINPSHFFLRHNFTEPGAYYIQSDITSTALVYVDIPIDKIKIHCPNRKLSGETFVITMFEHLGTNVTYEIDFDNGTIFQDHAKSFTYFYAVPGIYRIKIEGINSVTRKHDVCYIKIYDDISNLRFADDIAPAERSKETMIEWCIDKGTNVTYEVDFGDGQREFVGYFEPSRCHAIKHLYGNEGLYTVVITATNDMNPGIKIQREALVEVPIKSLVAYTRHFHLTSNVYLSVTDELEVHTAYVQGTNVVCQYDFGGNAEPIVSPNTTLKYTYKAVGEYNVNVTCSNSISKSSSVVNASIVVDNVVPISGLKVSISKTVFGEAAFITATMQAGSLFFCEWDLGDGTKLNVDQSTFINVIKHVYNSVGDYDVKLTCTNPIGGSSDMYKLPVEIPINGFGISCPLQFVIVNTELNFFVATGNGSRLSFRVTFGDGIEKTFEKTGNTSITLEHKYYSAGEYQVTIHAWNQLDQLNDSCPHTIIAENPVKGLSITTTSIVRLNPGNVVFRLMDVKENFPTNAIVDWNFGDGEVLDDVPFVNPQNGILKTYNYSQQGDYQISLLIRNNVSKQSFSFDVRVQEIIPIYMNVSQRRRNSDLMINGLGLNSKYFILGNMIIVNITNQPQDIEYIVDFNDGSSSKRSDSNIIEHIYQVPGDYMLHAIVNNELGTLDTKKEIIVLEKIENMQFSVTPFIQLGETINVEIIALKYGSDLCTVIDFGDNSVYIINNAHCHDMERNSSKNYTLFSNDDHAPIDVTYRYKEKGFYNVSFVAANQVSSFTGKAQVEVRYKPCPSPFIKISGGGNRTFPDLLQRSSGIVLQSNVTVDCPKADNVTFWWKVYNAEKNEIVVLKNNYGYRRIVMPFVRRPGGLDPTVFEIEKNVLPYGLMRIELSIFYESSQVDLSEFRGTDETWFEITPVDLEAVIEGGVRRAVGFQLDVPFDASKTKDPDGVDDDEEMVYQWYCRRKDEVFPQHFELINPTDITAGCFGNGMFYLTEGVGGFMRLNNDGSVVSIKTDLVQQQKYVMRVFVKKGNRRGIYDQEFIILDGAPPTLEILCTYNCFKKLDPSSELKIQSVCRNCNSTMKVFYQWRLYLLHKIVKDSGEQITEEVFVKDLESKTTTASDNANLALKKNVLELGQEYILRVSAWKKGANIDNSGFSDFVFTVNEHPVGGFCDITPREGFALTTVFNVRCGSWFDEDLPLRYKIDVKQDGKFQNMYTGYEREVSTILPLGDPKDNFNYEVTVTVTDSLEFGTTESFKVKVIEPASVDFDAVSDDLQSMATSGDIQSLARVAYAAGSLMNRGSDTGKNTTKNSTDSKATREKMIKSLKNVKPCTLSEIKQMGGVQAEMTSVADEISEEAEEESGDALASMSECMLQADGSDPNIGDTADVMFAATANVLNVGLSSGKNVTNKTSKSPADKTLDTMNKIGGALMRQMVAGDKPKVINSGGLGIEMAQVSDNADDEETGFKIPAIEYILGNQSSIEVTGRKASIGAMVTSSEDNPYKGADGSDDLKSDVMGLALTGMDGNPMDLRGQEMTMFVKRNIKNDQPATEYDYDVKEGAMKVHRFNFTNNSTYMAIEVRPVDQDVKSVLFISYEKRPTVSNAVKNYTLDTLKETTAQGKLPHSYVRVYNAEELNGTGEYYIGIKFSPGRDEIYAKYGYVPEMKYTLRTWETVCKIWDDDLNEFSQNGCRVGPKTTFNKTHCICKIGGNASAPVVSTNSPGVSTTYSTTTYAATRKQTHLIVPQRKKVTRATFAGGFFVAPNPIDFSKAFAGFANLADNPVAFATVLSIFGAYLILLFWARREDRKDVERAGVTPLSENDSFDRQFYEITVFTGFTSTAATTANVFCQLCGDEGETEIRQLKDVNRKVFQKRGQDVFLASFPDFIGDMSYLRIWHDNSGKNPSWYLSRVMVHDLNEDRKYLFINDNTLAVEEGDGSLERVIPVAGPEEVKSFNHLFFSTTQKNITDNHIWFSVFIRPPKSRFTRVQRLSCCLTLLYCTMVTNAMFYEVAGNADPKTTLRIGPFAFTPAQIGIGIMTSLIIFPVNILIVGVFRSIGPKPSKEEMAKQKTKRFWWLYELFFCCPTKKGNEFIDIISSKKDKNDSRPSSRYGTLTEVASLDGSTIGLKMETVAQEKRREEKTKKLKKQKKKLPYWMKYFAWTLLVLTSFASAFFVVLYGFQFGKDKSAQWISALFISFIQDVCVSQPTKILGLALFIALVVKKPADDDDEEEENKGTNIKQQDEEFLDSNGENVPKERPPPKKNDIIRFQPPSKEKIAALRSYRLKELKMYNLIRDIFIYLMFVIALCQVTYSHLDPQSYNVRKSMENIFINGEYSDKPFSFNDVKSVNDVWDWLRQTIIPGLYAKEWYNGKPNKPGFIQDLYSNLFGGSRLRQLRVKNDSCTIHDSFHGIIDSCHNWYSWGNEETGQYNPGWTAMTNYSLQNPTRYSKSWEYQTAADLDTYPFVGSLATYRGGGFVGDMGKSHVVSQALIDHLKRHRWLDAQTRAVFLEVTVYNAQVNLFAIMNFVVEMTPMNGVELFKSIKIARLYTFGGSTESFTIACQFFVMLFFIISIYREGKKIYREKKSYFKGFWNLVEFSILIIVVATISVFFSRMLLVSSAVKKIEQHPGQFVSFNKVTQWDAMFSALTSIVVLLSCIKSIRLLQYNKTISLLASTLRGSAKPLAAFSVVFLVFFVAFTTFAYIMFVPYLADYKSFVTASETVLTVLLGGFKFGEIKVAKPVLGPIWFILIMLFGVMYIMNVFLSIIMETYANVKEDLSMQSQEYELVDFMVSKFMQVLGKGDGGRKAAMAEFGGEQKEEGEESEESGKGNDKKANFLQKMSLSSRKKYYKLLDEEIEMKFAQLDDSLNGFWLNQCDGNVDESDEVMRTDFETVSYINRGFDYHEIHEDLLMEDDLRSELAKWS